MIRQFTGKERDQETGLDYFGARYYGSALGRLTSPDEFKGGFDNLDGQPAFSSEPIGYADLSDPQTLNKYVYTRNNPLRYVDPDGHDFWDYLSGVGNAFVSDNAFGAGRASGGNEDFRAGQVVGDAVATITGTLETVGGIGGEAGGLALDVTGVGATVGVPVNIASAGAIAHGASTVSVAAGHLVAAAGALPRPGKGPGTVSKDQRDPKRVSTKTRRSKSSLSKVGNVLIAGRTLQLTRASVIMKPGTRTVAGRLPPTCPLSVNLVMTTFINRQLNKTYGE